MQVTTIGLDLAKNVFQVHGIGEDNAVAFNRPLRRADEACFAELVASSLHGASEDAMLIATLLVRADHASILAVLAQKVGIALRMSIARKSAVKPRRPSDKSKLH